MEKLKGEENHRPSEKLYKNIYSLPKEKEKQLRSELMSRNIVLKSGKAGAYPGLDEASKIISVCPEVWDGTCYRQGSWYRKSEKNGLYLIISSFELEGFERYREATITQSDFLLPRPATREEKREIVEDEEYKSLAKLRLKPTSGGAFSSIA